MSFGPLEKALERLDTKAWKQLKGKALPLVTQKHPRRQWSQLLTIYMKPSAMNGLPNKVTQTLSL